MPCKTLDYLKKYHYAFRTPLDVIYDTSTCTEKKYIWQFWAQGKEKAPNIVKICMDSVVAHHPDYEVRVLDVKNITQYIDIPHVILKKHHAGVITMTHLSDYIRLALLVRYGGIWADATVFFTEKTPSYILEQDFFLFKNSTWCGLRHMPTMDMVTRQHKREVVNFAPLAVSSWFIKARPQHYVLRRVLYLLEEYWKQEDTLVYYFLLHSLFTYAFMYDSSCTNVFFSMLELGNVQPHTLQNFLFDSFSKNTYEAICQWPIHKLLNKEFEYNTIDNSFLNYIFLKNIYDILKLTQESIYRNIEIALDTKDVFIKCTLPMLFDFVRYKIYVHKNEYIVMLECDNASGKIACKDFFLSLCNNSIYEFHEDRNAVRVVVTQVRDVLKDLRDLIALSVDILPSLFTATECHEKIQKSTCNKVFDNIYRKGIWERGSGRDADAILCKRYMAFVENFIRQNTIASVADVGCGDWQFSKNMDFSSVQYTGYDVASDVIALNKKLYRQDNITFTLYDGNFDNIRPAQLLVCKDCLHYLPNEYIQSFMKNLHKFQYALLCHDRELQENTTQNRDTDLGAYRRIDLRLPPFTLPTAEVFTISRKEYTKSVLLWVNEEKRPPLA